MSNSPWVDSDQPPTGSKLRFDSDEPPTVTLTDFLLARIAEDEAAARAVKPLGVGGWHQDVPDSLAVLRYHTREEDGYMASKHDREASALFARHDPARVLADCEAKRRIVEHYQQCVTAAESDAWRKNRISRERSTSWVIALEPVLHMLALPYAAHPDYNSDWRP